MRTLAYVSSIYGFIPEQTPSSGEINFRTKFLNRDIPVFPGAEKIAVKYGMPVLFEPAAGLPEHLITETYLKRLVEIIREKPEYWLWRHRRWKYKRVDTNG